MKMRIRCIPYHSIQSFDYFPHHYTQLQPTVKQKFFIKNTTVSFGKNNKKNNNKKNTINTMDEAYTMAKKLSFYLQRKLGAELVDSIIYIFYNKVKNRN